MVMLWVVSHFCLVVLGAAMYSVIRLNTSFLAIVYLLTRNVKLPGSFFE